MQRMVVALLLPLLLGDSGAVVAEFEFLVQRHDGGTRRPGPRGAHHQIGPAGQGERTRCRAQGATPGTGRCGARRRQQLTRQDIRRR